MRKKPLPEKENIYKTECPILYVMKIVGKKMETTNSMVYCRQKNNSLQRITTKSCRHNCYYAYKMLKRT